MPTTTNIPIPSELIEQIQAFHAALDRDDEVACVLLGVSFLDKCVASLLQAFLVAGDNSAAFLHHRGALGEFFNRVRAAYCLGLIPKTMLQDLNTMGEIRNQFAHDFLKASFNDTVIAGLCDDLPEITMPDEYHMAQVVEAGIPAKYQERTVEQMKRRMTRPEMKFIGTAVLLAESLLAIAATTKRQTKHPGYENGSWLMRASSITTLRHKKKPQKKKARDE